LINKKLFASSGKPTETPTTIIQALMLMNGGMVGKLTTEEAKGIHRRRDRMAKATTAETVQALYFDLLARPPRPEELKRAVAHIEAEGADRTERTSDVVWVLLNSIEFRTNH